MLILNISICTILIYKNFLYSVSNNLNLLQCTSIKNILHRQSRALSNCKINSLAHSRGSSSGKKFRTTSLVSINNPTFQTTLQPIQIAVRLPSTKTSQCSTRHSRTSSVSVQSLRSWFLTVASWNVPSVAPCTGRTHRNTTSESRGTIITLTRCCS